MKFQVIDLETTGLEPSKGAEICEFAVVTAYLEGGEFFTADPTESHLVKPSKPIPTELSAVHHITNRDVESKQPWADFDPWFKVNCIDETIMVAHNAEFEKSFLVPNTIAESQRWICTWKCALRMYEDAPSHSNVALGYYLDILKGRSSDFHAAHTAGWDAELTAEILSTMLNTHTVGQLLKWSSEMPFLKFCPIGKHKGQLWADVPYSYLTWLMNAADMRKDIKNAVGEEIRRRSRVTE